MKSLLLLFPLLIVAGCRNPASGYVPVPPEDAPKVSLDSVRAARDVMPLAVGNHWTYSLHDQVFGRDDKPTKDQVLKADVDAAARWPDGTIVLEFRVNGSLSDRQAWHGDATGLYLVESGVQGASVRPALPLFTLPLKAGKRFDWKGRGPSAAGEIAQTAQSGEILAPQNADLVHGTVSAIPVVTHTTAPDGQIDSTAWFQPGVGMVRLYQETKTSVRREVLTFTLAEHTMKSR